MVHKHDPDWPYLKEILFEIRSPNFDEVAYSLFLEGEIHHNVRAREELIEYLDYWYDIDYEQVFDWEDIDSPTAN